MVCLSSMSSCICVGEYKGSQEWFMTRDVQDVRVVSKNIYKTNTILLASIIYTILVAEHNYFYFKMVILPPVSRFIPLHII